MIYCDACLSQSVKGRKVFEKRWLATFWSINTIAGMYDEVCQNNEENIFTPLYTYHKFSIIFKKCQIFIERKDLIAHKTCR